MYIMRMTISLVAVVVAGLATLFGSSVFTSHASSASRALRETLEDHVIPTTWLVRSRVKEIDGLQLARHELVVSNGKVMNALPERELAVDQSAERVAQQERLVEEFDSLLAAMSERGLNATLINGRPAASQDIREMRDEAASALLSLRSQHDADRRALEELVAAVEANRGTIQELLTCEEEARRDLSAMTESHAHVEALVRAETVRLGASSVLNSDGSTAGAALSRRLDASQAKLATLVENRQRNQPTKPGRIATPSVSPATLAAAKAHVLAAAPVAQPTTAPAVAAKD